MTHEEIEAKFLDIDPAEIEKKLTAVGAKKVRDFSYRRRVFDYPDWRLDKNGGWLRLRDEGDRITLAFKQRLGIKDHGGLTNDSGMREVEIKVSDFEKTATLLLDLGFVEKHYAENKRTRWEKDGVEFDIDTWPQLEPYLEIEADSWEAVDAAAKELGLNPEDKKIFSANQIYAQKGIDVGEYSRLAFDGLVKRGE